MKPSVAPVDNEDSVEVDFRPTDAATPRDLPAPAKFVYASGSQPLSGYTIKRGVGHGGFGEVYYAVSDAGKEVALKLIRRNLDVELRGMRHCLNLKHPNLLAIYDIRRDERDDNWVIMEYVSGHRLDEVIAAHPQGMPREQALAWFFGMAAGVACLHDHGIVHRDLKPGNIFCDEGVVKLGDYGLAKFISCSRRSGQTESVGTVHYMAPEIANGRYGKEIDIYALGVILYEMLTGRVPFEGESVGEVLMKHLTAEPDLSALNEPFRTVVARALDKDPAKRFKSVTEMLAELPRPARPEVYAGPLPAAGLDRGFGSAGGAGDAGLPQAAPPVPTVDEEPIFMAVRALFRRACDTWRRSSFNLPTKIALLVVGTGVLLMTSGAWLSVLIFLVMLYASYWVVRAILTALLPRSSGAAVPLPPPPSSREAEPRAPSGLASPMSSTMGWSPQAAPAPQAKPRRRIGPRFPEGENEVLVLGSPRERLTQWFGSLVGGSLATLAMGLVMLVLNGFRDAAAEPELWSLTWWSRYAWLVVVSVSCTWAVLTVSKFWEGRAGDAMLRRFVLMVVGLGLGLVAFGATRYFGVELNHDHRFVQILQIRPHHGLSPSDGWAGTKYYLAAFATLFFIVRWWRLADPARHARMSLWAIIVCVFLAALAADLWGFPQPWLPMVACAASVAVQLASPWVHPRDRRWQSA